MNKTWLHERGAPRRSALCARPSLAAAALLLSALASAQTTTSVTRSFYSNGLLQSETRDGLTTSFAYTSQGDLASVTYPGGRQTTYGNYKRGVAQLENQPEGVVIQRTVDDLGYVTSETNGSGYQTSYQVDLGGRRTLVSRPRAQSNPTTISYANASAGQSETETRTRGSLIEVRKVDGFGRPTEVTRAGIRNVVQYDGTGRRTFESNSLAVGDPLTGDTSQYDELDRVIRITRPDSSTATFTYGATGNGRPQISVTNERGFTTSYVYRAFGTPEAKELMAINEPIAGASVAMQRNVRGQVTSATQGGLTRGYTYDANFYLVSTQNPETGTTLYGRDSAGNMTTYKVGNGPTTTYTYDLRNRMTSIQYGDGTTPSVAKAYTPTDRLQSVSSDNTVRAFEYDPNGNLVLESLAIGTLTFSVANGYDGNDNLQQLTYPRSGRIVDFQPDPFGRPTRVSGYLSAVQYWPSGQLRKLDYANGTSTTYGQNVREWTSSFSTVRGTQTHVATQYSYDFVGNVTSITSTASDQARTLGYDEMDRLTAAAGPWGAGQISYDGRGNITAQTFGANSLFYTYDGFNRLSQLSGTRSGPVGYDAQGNIVSSPGATYTYDAAPNLLCVHCSDPSNKIEYRYDGTNTRVSAKKGASELIEFRTLKGLLLAEYAAADDKLTEYFYLGDKRIAQTVSIGEPSIVYSAALQPTTFSYGAVAVGGAASASFQLSNNGNAALSISGIAASAPFSLESSQCGVQVPPQTSCAITVGYSPTTAASHSGTLTVTIPGLPAQTAALSGSGVTYSATLSPTSYSFGSRPVGTSTSTMFTLSNVGTGAVSVSPPALTGAGASAYGVSHNCPASLVGGASCSATLSFTPAAAGTFSATLSFMTSGGEKAASVSGTAATPNSVATRTTPASLAFGSVLRGTTAPQGTVSFRNDGNTAMTLTGLAGLSAPFSIASNSCNSIAPGQTCSMVVSMATGSTGSWSQAVSTIGATTNTSLTVSGGVTAITAAQFTLYTNSTEPANVGVMNQTGTALYITTIRMDNPYGVHWFNLGNQTVQTPAMGQERPVNQYWYPGVVASFWSNDGDSSTPIYASITLSNGQKIQLNGYGWSDEWTFSVTP